MAIIGIIQIIKALTKLLIKNVVDTKSYESKDSLSITQFDCKNFPEGIYFIEAIMSKQIIHNKKIIVFQISK